MAPTTSHNETSPPIFQRSPTSQSRGSVGSKSDLLPKSWYSRLAYKWRALVEKIKYLSQPLLFAQDALDSLFESSDDDFFGRSPAKYSQITGVEFDFLLDYKRLLKLEKVFQAQSEKEPQSQKSSQANISSSYLRSISSVPQFASSEKQQYLSASNSEQTKQGDSMANGAIADINSGTLMSLEPVSSGKEQEEGNEDEHAPAAVESGSATVVVVKSPTQRRYSCNLGEKLWEERRKRWLETDLDAQHVKERQAALSLAHINRKLHSTIYTMFVHKAKPLKSGKRINLEDLMNVINAGWTKDAKWDRAAKGLP